MNYSNQPICLALGGANGFTGRFICLELIRRKINFFAVIRPTNDIKWMRSKNIEVRFADLSNKKELSHALQGANTYINASSIGFGNINSILDACKRASIKRVVFISTTAIFTALNASSKRVRLEAEKQIKSSELDWTILRPTMIYGSPKDRNMIKLIKWIDNFPFLPVFGSGKYLQQPVFVADVAWACVEVLNHESTKFNDFNISGKFAYSFIEIIKIVSKVLNKNTLIVKLPSTLIIIILKLIERSGFRLLIKSEQIQRLNEDKSFSYNKAAKIFNYSPLSFIDGITREINEYKNEKV